MANITKLLALYKDGISSLPEFTDVGLSKRQVTVAFAPQTKDKRPESYPGVAISYDFDKRERWAAIDKLTIFINVEMKEFEQVRILSEAIRNYFHSYTHSDNCIIVYHSFFDGGNSTPMLNKEHETYETYLEFSVGAG